MMTEYSGLAGGMYSRRLSSRLACSMHRLGRLGAPSKRLRNWSDLFFRAVPVSPSSRWMALNLLAKIGAALGVGQLCGDVLLQFLLDLRDFELGGDRLLDGTHPFDDVRFFEHILFVRRIQGEAAGDEIG